MKGSTVNESTSDAIIKLQKAGPGKPFRIVNPCTDFGFKRAFHNPTVLIDFLNHIFDYKDSEKIVELTYVDNNLRSSHEYGRAFTVDIVCTTKSNRYFLLEMQNAYTDSYADKAYVEFARFLSNIDSVKVSDVSRENEERHRIGETDVEAKDFWLKIEEICTLVISNKKYKFKKKKGSNDKAAEPDIINTYRMLHEKYPSRTLGSLNAKVVLIMLANFEKTEDQLTTDTDRWLFALKDERLSLGSTKIEPFKEISDIDKATSKSEALKQFYAELSTSNIGESLLVQYEKGILEENIVMEEFLNESFEKGLKKGEEIGLKEGKEIGLKKGEEIGLKKGEEKGEEKGLKKGEEIGSKESSLRIAKNLKGQKLDPKAIVAATGLSLEEIENI